MVKKTLDKDLGRFDTIEAQAMQSGRSYKALALAVLFLLIVWAFSASVTVEGEHSTLIIIAAIIGGYMALNIGANDVANNVGPAVGSRALTMLGALIIAAVFEAAGAILAGGDVVNTIQKGIIDPSTMQTSTVFVFAMISALFSAALWVNIATWIGAPVSTTHAVVGGVMGAGIAAAGFDVVHWNTMGAIAASWVISPVMGGVIAAIFLAFIKTYIIYTEDKIAAARRWVPVLVAIMAGAFAAYLALKGLSKLVKIDLGNALLIGLGVAVLSYFLSAPVIKRKSIGLENRNKSLKVLFGLPLV
ncbi:MAG: inorganic phosphate transporter, partial [Alphaproteobacteria bacterium]